MNPPSALHGAMSRDRKPFTYTPGGLNLSEIKSQRMAQRLMRNAMNQGVPEIPVQPVHSQSNSSAPVVLPNFNCLPVQVFPTMNLPTNPKTLLRTRSNPDPRYAPIQRVVPPFVNNARNESNDTFNKNSPPYPQINNNRPMSTYEQNWSPINAYTMPRTNYGSDGYTAPVLTEKRYDAQFCSTLPKPYSETEQLSKLLISEEKDQPKNESVETSIDVTVNPIAQVTFPIKCPTPVFTKPAEANVGTENEQREVKVVKKQVKKENKVEEQNGNQNGEAEAEMTVKLPTKKSGAKTETKVEIVKKILPDGTVEEIKTTTTKTTIDGRTEIKTKTETRTLPKEEVESEEEVLEEEEEEEEDREEEQEEEVAEEPQTVTTTIAAPKENGQESKVVKTEERSETTTTKKVVVVQESPKQEEQSVEVEEEEEEEVEEEEVVEAEPVTLVLKKLSTPEPETVKEPESVEKKEKKEIPQQVEEAEEEVQEEVKEIKKDAEEEEEDEEEVEEEEVVDTKEEEVKPALPKEEEEEVEEEEVFEEADIKVETEVKAEPETESQENKGEKEEKQTNVDEKEPEKEVVPEKSVEEPKEELKQPEEKVIKVEVQAEEPKSILQEDKPEPTPQTEFKIPIREPSIPLDKVEDVEIKPIGGTPIISKTHTEDTEIFRSTIDPSLGLSRQTEYNKIENIVTVNRTTKILDHSYENLTQQGIPTVKTYFPPPSTDRISTSPMPSRPYQPVYAPEREPRRHSLLLERLSMERQMPPPTSDIYQYSNQSYEQTQYQSEPQSEVLTVSNVKPSSINKQQWYQQKNQQQNILYNNVTSSPTPTSQPWAQPKSQPQPQQQFPPQQHYQAQHQPKQQYQPQSQPQTQYQPPSTPQPQYQPSYTEPTPERAPSHSSYTPTPTWVSNTGEPQQNVSQSNQYAYQSKDTTDNYQKSTQQYSSSYVPPPWEQDVSYTSVNNSTQSYYKPTPLPRPQSFSPASVQGWKQQSAKFNKNAPIAYIPPAPNQSFVRSASIVEPPKTPGRKTYYSEYERRYITVPESTYIPTETKFQPQPDPSPQYYYDNNEPTETVEPQWRRELREFAEKTSQTTITTEQTTVQPPWEADSKSAKTLTSTYTPTPTWSQTLRPNSWRERSFESEYVSQDWAKTNTLGRARPLSTLSKSVDTPISERTRGVSVDRYNSNYQSPAEHPPVQSHTLTTPAPHAGYHNPNVPAYHTRASAEPREQPTSYQPRVLHRENRASPLQSRSFKYLQWITGTEN